MYSDVIKRATERRATMHFNSVLEWANQLKADRFAPYQGEICEIHEEPSKGMYAVQLRGLDYLCEFFRVLDKVGERDKVRNIQRTDEYALAVLMEY